MNSSVKAYFEEHIQVVQATAADLEPAIKSAAELLLQTIRSGGKILIMGNGGSAADSQHFAAELVGRFRLERRGLPAIALSTDTSAITAISNDYGFEAVFSRQVEALGQPGDVVVGLSTSGNSVNVLNACVAARQAGCKTIALLGHDGGKIAACVDLALVVPATVTAHIQEAHIVIVHLLCDLVERRLTETEAV